MAEDTGFGFALISDQGQSPFVWSVLGAIAQAHAAGPEDHIAAIRTYVKAGYDHICVHQVGKDQKGFILPALRSVTGSLRKAARRTRKR